MLGSKAKKREGLPLGEFPSFRGRQLEKGEGARKRVEKGLSRRGEKSSFGGEKKKFFDAEG